MDGTSVRDVRLEKVKELEDAARAAGPAPRCCVCDRRLPRGVDRSHCLEHSEYAQRLIRHERGRRGTRVRLREVA
ncbi:MAG: hypothetical protein M9894_26045 [Planctomycetes bacterium]|nr:hypothetical protein [Planctomycetota bacterium]